MQDADHDTPPDEPHNESRVLLSRCHADALMMTLAALSRSEDAPPLSEEDYILARFPLDRFGQESSP